MSHQLKTETRRGISNPTRPDAGGGGAVAVTLEPQAAQMLRRYCALSEEDFRDVINVAVINWLEAKLEDEDDLPHCYDGAVRAAKRRRLRRARQGKEAA